MPDPIQRCFSYGQLWPLRPACIQNWARLYMLDPTFSIQFSSILPRKAPFILCKTGPDLIWMAQSGLSQTDVAQV